MNTVTSAGRPLSNGWELSQRKVKRCAGNCGLYVDATQDYITGPVVCIYCDTCRPGPHCFCDLCTQSFPSAIPAGQPF